MARWRPTPHFDPSELERGIDRATLRRAWTFARPYRGLLGLQLAGLAGTAIMGILPPLVLKALVDRAVAHRLTTGGVNVLVAAAVAIALTMTALGLLNRWLGSRIGEGLIYDLRVGAVRPRPADADRLLHPHPDRLAAVSRLSNDVLGAQQAVGTARHRRRRTSSRSSSRSPPCCCLSWQVTAAVAARRARSSSSSTGASAERLAALSRAAHATSTPTCRRP